MCHELSLWLYVSSFSAVIWFIVLFFSLCRIQLQLSSSQLNSEMKPVELRHVTSHQQLSLLSTMRIYKSNSTHVTNRVLVWSKNESKFIQFPPWHPLPFNQPRRIIFRECNKSTVKAMCSDCKVLAIVSKINWIRRMEVFI